MAEIRQNADGSLSVYGEGDGINAFRAGGPKTPAPVTGAKYRVPTTAIVPLGAPTAAGNLTGSVLAWSNPDGIDCYVDLVRISITGTAGLNTIDVGTSPNATSGSNNLITQLALSTPGIFDNVTDKGASGKSRQYLTAGSVVVATPTITCGALIGNALINFVNVGQSSG